MKERGDDTTEPGAESPRAPGGYYYDDATGYELFDPEEDEGGEEAGEPEGPAAPQRRRPLSSSRRRSESV